MQPPQLVAHRGYPLRYPENTLVGIDAALRLGARYLEVDVQLSADRVPVLFHDRTLGRVCGATGAVHDRTATELRTLRAHEPDSFGGAFAQVPIPTLEELVATLDQYPLVTCFVEIKPVAVERFGLKTVVGRVLDVIGPVSERSVVISFDPDVIPEAHRGPSRTGLILRTWKQRLEKATLMLEPDYVFCNVAKLPRSGELQAPAAPLAVYDVVDPQLAVSLGRRGVAMVETFAIGEMLEALRAHPFKRDA